MSLGHWGGFHKDFLEVAASEIGFEGQGEFESVDM